MKNKILEQDMEFTRMSSKGQIVIPKEIRENLRIKEGDLFAATADNDLIILKKMKYKALKEDLMLLREAKKGWDEIEQGKSKTMDEEEFFKEIEKW